MSESQNIEWKRSWHDKYLEWVCGFANAQGGTIYIGKDDDGSVHGLANAKQLLEIIPQKVRSLLGLTIDVNLHQSNEGSFIEIPVRPQSVPVSLYGHYYYRSGSTKTELSGASLNEFLFKKSGRTWDASIEDRATFDDIDTSSIARFIKDAASTGRLPDSDRIAPIDLLKKLRLAQGDQLTCAALVLFGKDPAEFYPGISVRIGRFGSSDTDLQFQEVVEGNLIYCLREAMQQILGKFTIKPIRFEGIQRIESPQYPIEALREVLLNAMVHRRYQSGVHVQIRVYADRLICWNEGPLPAELSMADLLGLHTSYPRNPLIANACFKAGYIDSWGRGIEKITESCRAADLPDPLFEESQGGMRVTLYAQVQADVAKATGQVTGQVTEQVTEQVATLIGAMSEKREYTRAELMKKLSLKHRETFHTNYLKPALENASVEMTIPDKPTSRLQKYRLTEKGQQLIR